MNNARPARSSTKYCLVVTIVINDEYVDWGRHFLGCSNDTGDASCYIGLFVSGGYDDRILKLNFRIVLIDWIHDSLIQSDGGVAFFGFA
jgi:hypothetical protein